MKVGSLLVADTQRSEALRIPANARGRRRLAAILAHSGDSWFWLLGLALTWLLGDSPTRTWAIAVAAAIGVLAIVVLGLKKLVRRPRPEGDWGQIYRATDPHSFPSGHAARAFLLAVLATGWGPVWLAPILWIWAPLVCLARVALGVHFLSDVAVGAVIGIVVGLAMIVLAPI
ncbi:MAG: phosphatase PAP2 family protein [Anaerolineales bacterium]|nr:phosphatase PAP2 family protein [Anaerolineales bacterium]